MRALAANDVMVLTESERRHETRTDASLSSRESLSTRIAKELGGRPRSFRACSSRATAAQPA